MINPWNSEQSYDYKRLMTEFGITKFNFDLEGAPAVFKRGIVFGHRDFQRIYDYMNKGRKFAVLTGLMPSGKMHLGHKMVIDQVVYYQKFNSDITIAVADIESYSARGINYDRAKKIAMEEYISSYYALGLDPDRASVYFQSERTAVKDFPYRFGKHINFSEMKAIYGFGLETNMGHMLSPLIQVGDILHVQNREYSGPVPTLVPVGIDQDPHLRLTRGIAHSCRFTNVIRTKDGRIGIFVKKDDNVEKILNKCRVVLERNGFKKLGMMLKYKALYIDDAGDDDIENIDNMIMENVEKRLNPDAMFLPSSTYHRFISGLDGGKMSSSKPETAIFLSDNEKEIRKKISRAKTGGATSVEEHKRNGGNPDVCSVFEMNFYYNDDDKAVNNLYASCRKGDILCGECKRNTSDFIVNMVKDIQEKKKSAEPERFLK